MKVIRKAKDGKSFPDLNKDGKITKADILKGRGVIAKKGAVIKKAQNGVKATKDSTDYYRKQASDFGTAAARNMNRPATANRAFKNQKEALDNMFRQSDKGKPGYDKNGFPVKKKMKTGGMIKRADGSVSKRGLWDNIRANKGSGKKPTAAMLKQEKKIKAKGK